MTRGRARDALLCLARSAKWSKFFIKDGDRALASIVLGCIPTGRDVALATYDEKNRRERFMRQLLDEFESCYAAWTVDAPFKSERAENVHPTAVIDSPNYIIVTVPERFFSNVTLQQSVDAVRAFLRGDGWREGDDPEFEISTRIRFGLNQIIIRFTL